MKCIAPGKLESIVTVLPRYDNFIGGTWAQDLRSRPGDKMMLDHYSQTKNLLVSYSDKPLGRF